MHHATDHAAPTRATPPYQTDFTADEFIARRAKIAEMIGSTGIAVLRGLTMMAGAAFRQSNEFYYLCGVDVPSAFLLIDGTRGGRSTLYLQPINPQYERSDGTQLSYEDSELLLRMTGVDGIRLCSDLAADLGKPKVVYTPRLPGEGSQTYRDTLMFAARMNANNAFSGQVSPEEFFRLRLESVLPAAEFRDLLPLLDRLRVVKSPAEIAVMRIAGRLTAEAVVQAIRLSKPGVYEYQLAAAAEYHFRSHGARGGAYRAIVASGPNVWNAHYHRNSRKLENGDMILMDYAPDFNFYTSDIGRMWPAGGRYSPVFRQLYGFIVQYHKTLLEHIRAGLTGPQIEHAAAAQMQSVVDSTRWIKPIYQAAARKALTFGRHLTHSVGMAVHDPGEFLSAPIPEGIVLALDPQMWVPDEQLYVRVEDTVVIKNAGVENLTANAPVYADEIESILNQT